MEIVGLFEKNGKPFTLQTHQLEVVEHFRHNPFRRTNYALYAYHDTGTGKTLSAVAALCLELRLNPNAMGVIACPAGVRNQWEDYRTYITDPTLSARISIVSHDTLVDRVKKQLEVRIITPHHPISTKYYETEYEIYQKAREISLPFTDQTCFEAFLAKGTVISKKKNEGNARVIDLDRTELFVVVDEAQEKFKNECLFDSNSDELQNVSSWVLRFLSVFICKKLLLLSATPIVNGYEDLINPFQCLKLVNERGIGVIRDPQEYMRFKKVVHQDPKTRKWIRNYTLSGFTQEVFGFRLTSSVLQTRITSTPPDLHFIQNLLHYTKRHSSNPCYPKVVMKDDIKLPVDTDSLFFINYKKMVESRILKTERAQDVTMVNVDGFYVGELLNQFCIYEYQREDPTTARSKKGAKEQWTYPYTVEGSVIIEKWRPKINTNRNLTERLQDIPLMFQLVLQDTFPILMYSPLYEYVRDLIMSEFSKTVIFTQKKETQHYCYHSLMRDLHDLSYRIQILDSPPWKEKVDAFNDTKTSDDKGEVLFITRSGSKGVDLRGVDNIIFLEMPFSYMEERQIIGRGQRFESHKGLPRNHQTVNVYKLYATFSSGWKCANEMIQSIVNDKKVMETNFITAIESVCGIMEDADHYQTQFKTKMTPTQRVAQKNDCTALQTIKKKSGLRQATGLSGFVR